MGFNLLFVESPSDILLAVAIFSEGLVNNVHLTRLIAREDFIKVF
jgi:hypothetical protein